MEPDHIYWNESFLLFDIKTQEKTLLDLFNEIKLNKEVVYAQYEDLFKIYKNAPISTKWIGNSSNGIKIYVSTSDGGLVTNFLECNITLTVASVKMNSLEISHDTLRDRINSIFETNLLGAEKEGKYDGYLFYLAEKVNIPTFNREIMADLTMVEMKMIPFVMDESEKTNKEVNYIYFHYYKNKLQLTLTFLYHNNDAKDKTKHVPEYFANKNYIRIYVRKVPTTENLEELKKDIGILFDNYTKNSSRISEEYKKYGVNLENDINENKLQIKSHKPYADFPFYSNEYSKICQKKFQPTMINTDEKTDQPYLDFEGKRYICDRTEENKFPGFKKNTNTGTNTRYPNVICCFKKEKQVDKKKRQQDAIHTFIVSSRALKKGQSGDLTPSLDKFFRIVFGKKYVRVGMSENDETSLLDCLSVEKETLLEKKMLSSQNNPGEIFDYRFFADALEDICDSFIFVFSDSGFVIPYFVHGHYGKQNRTRTIFLYANSYLEKNIPRYEIIRSLQKDDTFISSQDAGAIIISLIYTRLIVKYYILDKPLMSLNFLINYGDKIKGVDQFVDVYGKVRKFTYKYGEKNFTVFTSPTYPIFVPLSTKNSYFTIKPDTAFDIAKIMGFSFTHCMVGDDGINALCYENKIVIPVTKTNSVDLPSIPSIIPSNKSFLLSFQETEKKAKLLMEYTYWFYKTTGKDVNKFFSENVKVEPNVVYSTNDVLRTFSDKNPFIVDGILILPSEEVKKRLRFVVEQYNSYNKPLLTSIPLEKDELKKYPDQLLIQGDSAVYNYINKSYKKNFVSIKIQEQQCPYFIKLKNIVDKVFLAQNADSKEGAQSIASIWSHLNYNVVIPPQNARDLISKNTYTLITSNDSIVQKVYQSEKKDTMIIEYKINNALKYVVLFNLDKELPTLEYDEKKEPKLGLFKNDNASCYIDSVLVSLFAIPNNFITSQFLEKNIKEEKIQNDIFNIIKHIKAGDQLDVCSSLRRHLHKYNKEHRIVGDDVDFKSAQLSPWDVMLVLFDVFSVPDYLKWKNEGGDVIYSDKYIFFPLQNEEKEKSINNYVNDPEITETKTIQRNYETPPFLYISFGRLTNDHQKITTPVTLEPTLSIGGKKMTLTSFIVHKGGGHSGHYISYLLLDDGWYKYDDLKTNLEKVENVFENEDIKRNVTDLFYLK